MLFCYGDSSSLICQHEEIVTSPVLCSISRQALASFGLICLLCVLLLLAKKVPQKEVVPVKKKQLRRSKRSGQRDDGCSPQLNRVGARSARTGVCRFLYSFSASRYLGGISLSLSRHCCVPLSLCFAQRLLARKRERMGIIAKQAKQWVVKRRRERESA